MSIIAWIVLGAIAGWLAGLLVKGDERLGVIGHILLGIAGALVGGFLAGALFGTDPIDGPFDISSIVTAVIGAIILVASGVIENWAVGAGAVSESCVIVSVRPRWSPSSFAVLFRLFTSEPACGSVRSIAPMSSPEARPGR